MHSTPVSLLDRLRTPNQAAAWDRFVELYTPLLYHWARQLGQQDSDAADLVQDVFLILWRTLPDFQYEPRKSFHAWLKTLFVNRARQRFRDHKPVVGDGTLVNIPDPATSQVEEQEYRQYLFHRAFQLLQREFSAQHVTAFREYVLACRPVEEVARQVGLSAGTIYCIKSRILNRLRQDLARLLD